jgi:hypothetical protein
MMVMTNIEKYLGIFILAFIVRIMCLLIINHFGLTTLVSLEDTEKYLKMDNPPAVIQLNDASDYYHTVVNNLVVPKVIGEYWGYTEWYQRQLLHTLVLYITNNSVVFQILLSCITVVLLYRVNALIGLIYLIYPQSVVYSCLLTKVTLMIFLVAVLMNLTKNRWWLMIGVVCIPLLFINTFNIHPETTGILREFNRPYINKLMSLWSPFTNHTQIVFGNWLMYAQMPFYLFVMVYFCRNTTFTNVVLHIVVLITIGGMMQYTHEFHREFLIPLILNFEMYQRDV